MSYKLPLYQALAQHIEAAKVETKHEYVLEALMKHAPSGSGIDSGTKLLLSESNKNKLVFQIDFHHMDSNGYYCGWSSRKMTVESSLTDVFSLDFQDEDYSGVDMQCYDEETGETYECQESFEVEDYLADTYRWSLQEPVEINISMFEPTKLGFHGELVLT